MFETRKLLIPESLKSPEARFSGTIQAQIGLQNIRSPFDPLPICRGGKSPCGTEPFTETQLKSRQQTTMSSKNEWTRTLADVDHHGLAVDVLYLDARRFSAACSGGIEQHQEDKVQAVGCIIDQPYDLLAVRAVGSLCGTLRKMKSLKARSRRFRVCL